MGLPTARYYEIDQSTVPPVMLTGAHAVVVSTLFGPADKPYPVSTVDGLKSLFGGPDAIKAPFFAQLRRAIARGTKLYIQRLLGTGATAASYVFTTQKVTITAKDQGAWANGILGVTYSPKGAGATCTIKVVYAPNTEIQETFTADTFDNLLVMVNANSKRITMTTTTGYVELPQTDSPQYLTGGADGTFDTDVTRAAAINTLLSKFNDLTDIDTVSALGIYNTNHLENIATYAESRGDVMAIFEIDPSFTAAQAQSFIDGVTRKSSYLAIYYGSKLTAFSVEDNKDVDGPILMDVASVYSYNDTKGSRHMAPAGSDRGLIPNVKTFASNLLSPARKTEADGLANKGVNIVGSHPVFGPVVWGAATRAMANSAFDAIHVRRMLIDLSQTAMPIFQSTLFDPVDPTTWRLAYGRMKPILQNLEAERAIYPGWQYIGDQEASSITDAKYNKKEDLAVGQYRVKVPMVPVGYTRGIDFTVQVNNLLSLYQTQAQ